MERDDDVIELGAVTLETKGLLGRDPDWSMGQSVALSED